jgi:hypothetical protein
MKTFRYPQLQAAQYGLCSKVSDMVNGMCGFLRYASQSGYHSRMLQVKYTGDVNQEGTNLYGASNTTLASPRE